MVEMHEGTRARAKTSAGSNRVDDAGDNGDGNGRIDSSQAVGKAAVQHVRELCAAGRDSDVASLLHARRALVGWLLGDLVQCAARNARAGGARTATTVHTARLLDAVHVMVQLDDLLRQVDDGDGGGDTQSDAMRSLPATDDDWRAWCTTEPSATSAPGRSDSVVNDESAALVPPDVDRAVASLACDRLPLTDAVWQRWATIDQDAWLAAVTALAQLVVHGTATKRRVSRAFSTHLASARRVLARAAGASIPFALAPSLWPRLPSAVLLTPLLMLLALDRAFNCVASHPPTASDRSRIITMLRLHTQPILAAASTTGTDLATAITSARDLATALTSARAPWPVLLARTAYWLTSARAPSGLTALAAFYRSAPESHVATALRATFRTAISASADSDTAPTHPILAAGVLMLARCTRAEPAYAAWLAALVHRDAWSILIPHAPTARRALGVLESLVPWDRAQILRVHARALTVGSAATASRTSNVAHVRPALRGYLNAVTDRVGKVPPEDAVRLAGVVLSAYVPPRDSRAARATSAAEVGKLGAGGGGKDAAKRVPAKLAQFLMVRVKWVVTALLPALWRRAVEKGGEERMKVASLMADLVLCGKVPAAVFDQWVRVRDDDEEVGEDVGETVPGSQADRTPTPVGSDAMDVDGPVGVDAVFVVPRVDVVVDCKGVRVVADTTTAAPAVNAVVDTWRRVTAVSTAPMTTAQLAHLAHQFYTTVTTSASVDLLVPVHVRAPTPATVLPSLRTRANQLDPFVSPLTALVLAWSLAPLAPFPDPTEVFVQALFLTTITSTTSFPVLATLPCGLSTSPIAPNAWPLLALHKLLICVSRSGKSAPTAARAIRAVTANLPPPTVDDAVFWCTTLSPSPVLLMPPIRVAGSAADLVATCAGQPRAAAWIAASLVPTVAVTEGPVRAALNAVAGVCGRGPRAARPDEEEVDDAVAHIVRTYAREVGARTWGTAAHEQAREARVAARNRAVVGAPARVSEGEGDQC
ncbi:hypothetical protein GGF31_004250 [Allomyces arbusculus]|nr:hypothetical protein GGF31_004250 [Allomyces arbusculus]